MAIVTIQHRRGKYADYDPSKVLPGELVVTQTGDPNTTDGEAAYIATRAGSVKRIPFASEVEDLKTRVDDVVEDAEEAISNAIDPTLTRSGKAADAKVTGNEIANIKRDLDRTGISDSVKVALLACIKHIALWTDEHGQDYYNALETALYESSYPLITAVYDTTHTAYTDETVDTLKPYLTVTYYANKKAIGQVVSADDYTLSGALEEGINTVRVKYGDYSTLFKVNAIDYYNIHEWSSQSLLQVDSLAPGRYNNTCGYTALSAGYHRRSAWAHRGLKGAYNNNSQQFDDTRFPIPVPNDATKANITITSPDTVYFAAVVWTYNASTGAYTKGTDSGWISGSGEISLTPSDNKFISINMKNGTGGSSDFTTDPSVELIYS